MTEKRFNVHEQMSTILGYECAFDDNKKKWLSIRDVILLLNELSNENEQLKSRVTYLERKLDRERQSHQKQHEKWEKELQE